MEMKKQVLSFTEFISEAYKIIGVIEGTKGLNIYEQASDMSNIKSRMALVGSTTHITNNAGALTAFEKIEGGVTIKGKPIDENKALFKGEGYKGLSFWEIKEKTRKEKNYLKIGDEIITGDDKKLVSFTVSTQNLLKEPIEASGNGIFALGRAINLVRKEKLSEGEGTNIIIAMNTKKADSFVANAKTGFQAVEGKFNSAIMFTFVTSDGVIPNPKHNTHNVNTARNIKDPNPIGYVNGNAMPQLPKHKETLRKIDPIDAADFVNKIKGKKIASYTTELGKYVNEFVDTFFTPYIETYAKRFKEYLNLEAKEMGIDPKLFEDLMKYIDEWKTAQNGKKEVYKKNAEDEIKVLFTQKTQTGSELRPGATTSGKKIEGTVGKIQ
jgi:hypothetical protein